MNRELIIACLPYLVGIAVSVLALRVLVGLSGARLQIQQLGGLHQDQKGAVQSLSFVLTLPLFVMIMLFIVQLSQLTLGRLVVEYSAYAAARSAAVWIPATLGDDFETQNRIGSVRPTKTYTSDERDNLLAVYQVLEDSPKFEKIRLAAVTSLMSICPSRDTGITIDADGEASGDSLERTYLAMSPASVTNTRVPPRIRNKLAYAIHNTDVDIEIRHNETYEPPLEMVDDEGRPYFQYNEYGWQDQLVVTVHHNFALLPGPGRFLAKSTPRRDTAEVSARDRVAEQVRRENGIFVYPMSATVRLNNEGQKSVLPHIQSLNGVVPMTSPPPEPEEPTPYY